ncbi:hypothetical protein BC826DRAFT_968133 [Russula brevipes]|nr:hypothetical protein BC826DRAFT_968133 [Russula brevipes]
MSENVPVPGTTLLTLCAREGLIGLRLGTRTVTTDAAKEDPMIRGVLAAAMKGATDVAVRVTSLTGTETGSEKKTKSEDTATASTTGTATVIETEITTGTVVDAGVRKTATMHKKNVTRGSVARKVRMRRLLTIILATVHAGVLRELIPGIVMVIDVPDILVIPETNSTTRPDDPMNEEPREDDSEARSVFVSQLAARLTARDLGYFFEDKLGENTVLDARIVTDRLSRRSKGIGYVEFRSIEQVDKALSLSGTVVMGLPIMVQLTEAERNRLHPGDVNLNLPPGVSAPHGGAMQLYVGSLHFNLTEGDIKQVFEPFGELEFVDLHKDPVTGRSKGYAFVQYKRAEDARMALEQMDGFELAGRTLRVNTVHEKGTTKYTTQDSLDESGGGNLNAASRQALMQKLARIEPSSKLEPVARPNIQAMESRCVLLKNMFSPEEETDSDWDKELAEDVKGECETKYGPVDRIKVERESQGEIYLKFGDVDAARKAVQGLNGRWFGGKQVSAAFISDAIMQAHQ